MTQNQLSNISEKPFVAVVTLNYNQHQYTIDCIHSILKSDYDNFRIFLVDNGSEPENYFELKTLININKLELYRIEKNIGYVGGINYALSMASKLKPKYFLVMNNDTLLDSNAITALVESAERNGDCLISGKIYHYHDSNRIQYVGSYLSNKFLLNFKSISNNEIDTGQYETECERDLIDDVFWLLPFKLYEVTKGYSPYFWFNAEQADLVLRAKKMGYKILYTPKAKIWHKGSLSIGGRTNNPYLSYFNTQSKLTLQFLHLPFSLFVIVYINNLIRIAVLLTKHYLKLILNKKSSWEMIKAEILGVSSFTIWMFKRNNHNGYNPFSKN